MPWLEAGLSPFVGYPWRGWQGAGVRGRGWNQERWQQGLVGEGGCKPCCWGPGCCTAASLPHLQHPKPGLVRERGFHSPLAPLGFLPPSLLLLLIFPRGAAALLLAVHLCKPWGCQTLVCLGLASPSQALLLLPRAGTSFPGAASAAHLHPPCFVWSTLMSWDSS